MKNELLGWQKKKMLACLRTVDSEMSRWGGGLHNRLLVMVNKVLEDCFCDNPKIGEDAYTHWHCDACGGRIHKHEYELFEKFEQLNEP